MELRPSHGQTFPNASYGRVANITLTIDSEGERTEYPELGRVKSGPSDGQARPNS